MRETAEAEFPRSTQERTRFVNHREQVQRYIDMRGRLIDGIRQQPRMTLARRRVLSALERRVVPVTGWNRG